MNPNPAQQSKRPPVVETILGVQFEPLPKFRNAHLALFWKRLGKDWTVPNDAPLLVPQFEQYGAEVWRLPSLQLQVIQDASARAQIRNRDENRMIQVQNGRLHYNWLGQAGGDYPRYRTIRPEFDRVV